VTAITTALSEVFDGFADDLLAERNARPLIIVGASKVDTLLLEILSAYLIPKSAKASDSDELLEGDRPLATFSARIKLCYRLGLIDSTLYRALEDLRALRNPSAHSVGFDLAKSPNREHLAKLCDRMTTRKSFHLTGKRYFDASPLTTTEELQCVLLTLCVLLEAIRERTERTLGNRTMLEISKR
jgi:hypothetical protein